MPNEQIEKLETAPFDPRFPQQNQTFNCFRNYMDYHRCLDILEGDEKCEYFRKIYQSICPHAWVEKWDEQRELGTFPGRIVRVPLPDDICKKTK